MSGGGCRADGFPKINDRCTENAGDCNEDGGPTRWSFDSGRVAGVFIGDDQRGQEDAGFVAEDADGASLFQQGFDAEVFEDAWAKPA